MPPTSQPATTTKPDVAAALNAERAAIEAKLDALRASPSPEVAQLLRQADAAVADFRQQAATLEGQLAQIDAELGVRERDRRSAAEQQRAKVLASSREQLVSAVEETLAGVERAQGHLRAFCATLTEVFQKHGEVRALAVKISNGGRLPSGGLSSPDLVSRMGGSIAGTLATIRVPGALGGPAMRIGALELPNYSLYPASQSWRQALERTLMPTLHQLTNVETGKD